MSRATTVAVAAALALCAATGCSTTEVAEAGTTESARYMAERVQLGYNADARVVTDTETGDRWLVVWNNYHGGIDVEPLEGGE